MGDSSKTVIIKRAVGEGYSGNFGALLYLVALMGAGPQELEPANGEERAEWRGHLNGLRSALYCVAMHDRQIGPETAVELVREAIDDAVEVLMGSGQPDSSG